VQTVEYDRESGVDVQEQRAMPHCCKSIHALLACRDDEQTHDANQRVFEHWMIGQLDSHHADVGQKAVYNSRNGSFT